VNGDTGLHAVDVTLPQEVADPAQPRHDVATEEWPGDQPGKQQSRNAAEQREEHRLAEHEAQEMARQEAAHEGAKVRGKASGQAYSKYGATSVFFALVSAGVVALVINFGDDWMVLASGYGMIFAGLGSAIPAFFGISSIYRITPNAQNLWIVRTLGCINFLQVVFVAILSAMMLLQHFALGNTLACIFDVLVALFILRLYSSVVEDWKKQAKAG